LRDVFQKDLEDFLRLKDIELNDIDRFESSRSLREMRPVHMPAKNPRMRNVGTVCATIEAKGLSDFARILENE
jgi:hypothetical protein